MKKSAFSFSIFTVTTLSIKAQTDYYWIGGSGNWSELNHWTTSLGEAYRTTKEIVIPNNSTNVRFDTNSFTSTCQTVILGISSTTCNNMIRVSLRNTPAFDCYNNNLNIYSSLTLLPSMISGLLIK